MGRKVDHDAVLIFDDREEAGELVGPSEEELRELETAVDEDEPGEALAGADREILDRIDGEDILSEETPYRCPSTASSSIRRYFKDMRRGRILSADEERELARRYEEGDRVSRNTLIECNLRLVVNIAKRYINRGMEFIDLIEEGNVGLIKAIDRFKLSKGCRVSTYATWWIRNVIERALGEQARIIRIPIHVHEFLNQRRKVAKALIAELGRPPEIEELAWHMHGKYLEECRKRGNIPDAATADKNYKILYARLWWMEQVKMQSKVLSLDHVSNVDGGEDAFGDHILVDERDTPEGAFYRKEIKRVIIPGALDVLTEVERTVIKLRFGLGTGMPRTLTQIATIYDVSGERIRQIQQDAVGKMKCQLL